MLKLFAIPVWKQVLISLLTGCLLYGIYLAYDLGEVRLAWKRELAAHVEWETSGRKQRCSIAWAEIKEKSASMGCNEKLPAHDAYGDLISESVMSYKCVSKVLSSDSQLNLVIDKNGCASLDGMGVREVILRKPGDFWTYYKWSHLGSRSETPSVILLISSILLSVLIIGKLIMSETHIGWRRLSLVVAPLTGFGVAVYQTMNQSEVFPVVLGLASSAAVFVALLLGRRLALWVMQGFGQVQTSPTAQMPITQTLNAEPVTQQALQPEVAPEADQQPVSEPPTFQDVRAVATGWDRAYARGLDLIPVVFIGQVLSHLFPDPSLFIDGQIGFFTDRVWWTLLLVLTFVAYDTFWLSTWGTTPGKALLSIYIRTPEGEKLAPKLAFQRARIVVTRGLWLMVFFPVVQLVSGYQFIKKGTTPWDFTGRGVTYQRNVGSSRRALAVLMVAVFLIGYTVAQKVMKEIAKEELGQKIL